MNNKKIRNIVMSASLAVATLGVAPTLIANADGVNAAQNNHEKTSTEAADHNTSATTHEKDAANHVKANEGMAHVSITVMNVETGVPMANQSVVINGSTFTTNANGTVSDIPVRSGVYNPISVSAKGFTSSNLNVSRFENSKSYNETVNIAPIAAKQLVTFVDASGNPIKDTTINLYSGGGNQSVALKTNDKGQILMGPMWAGEQSFTAKADGYHSSQFTFNAVSGQTGETTVVLKAINQMATLNIKVVDVQTGKVMKNSVVTVNGSTMKTDANGMIEGIPVRANCENPITVGAKGFTAKVLDVQKFDANKTYTETVNLAPKTCTENITFVNAVTGQVIKNASVNLNVQGATQINTLKSNDNGVVTMSNLWAGTQKFTANIDGFQSVDFSFNANSNETGEMTVKVVPETATQIVTVVNGVTGQVMKNTKVEIKVQGGTQVNTLTTNAKGEVTMSNLWPGKQAFTISTNGFNPADFTFTAEANKTGESTVTLNPQVATQIVKVVDKTTGKVMKNTTIQIKVEGGTQINTFETNSKGEFTMNNLWPGKQAFTISVKGFDSANFTFNAEANKTGESTVSLTRFVEKPVFQNETVTVKDSDGNLITNVKGYVTTLGGTEKSPIEINANGQFVMPNLRVGHQEFVLYINDYKAQEFNFDVVAGKKGETTVVLTKNQSVPPVVKPDTTKPDTTKPEIVKPVVVKPETVKPVVVKPVVSENTENNTSATKPENVTHVNKTATTESTSSNPKTGDTSELPLALGILASIGGLVAINTKKFKGLFIK